MGNLSTGLSVLIVVKHTTCPSLPQDHLQLLNQLELALAIRTLKKHILIIHFFILIWATRQLFLGAKSMPKEICWLEIIYFKI